MHVPILGYLTLHELTIVTCLGQLKHSCIPGTFHFSSAPTFCMIIEYHLSGEYDATLHTKTSSRQCNYYHPTPDFSFYFTRKKTCRYFIWLYLTETSPHLCNPQPHLISCLIYFHLREATLYDPPFRVTWQ